jgi:hypothetical protein
MCAWGVLLHDYHDHDQHNLEHNNHDDQYRGTNDD